MSGGYWLTIVEGSWLTLRLALGSMALAVALGLGGAGARLSPLRPLAWLGEAYATVIRGIPDLVMILLVYFGGQDLVNRAAALVGHEDYIDIDPFAAGVATLGFIFGAYLSETFRGAFLSIPKGQVEAGFAYGMSRWQVFRRILWPETVRLSIPGIANNWLVLIKSTALVSVLGLPDMMFHAKQAGDATRQPFTYLLLAGALYLAITSVSLLALRVIEKRFSLGVREVQL